MRDPAHLESILPQPSHELTAESMEAFSREFSERFGTGMVDMYVKNGHWRHAYGGQQLGMRRTHDLVYLDNPTTGADQHGAFIMLLGECRYSFFQADANGLYIISTWTGSNEQKTRKHIIVADTAR